MTESVQRIPKATQGCSISTKSSETVETTQLRDSCLDCLGLAEGRFHFHLRIFYIFLLPWPCLQPSPYSILSTSASVNIYLLQPKLFSFHLNSSKVTFMHYFMYVLKNTKHHYIKKLYKISLNKNCQPDYTEKLDCFKDQ